MTKWPKKVRRLWVQRRHEVWRLRYQLRRRWYRLRHVDFYARATVEAPPAHVNAAPLLQKAINEVKRSEEYEAARARYNAYRWKWLHREPVLHSEVHLGHGVFHVSDSLDASGVTLRGSGPQAHVRSK